MAGGILLALVLLVVIPVGVLVAGAVAALVLGELFVSDADSRYEGSELVDLNR